LMFMSTSHNAEKNLYAGWCHPLAESSMPARK